MKMHALRRMRLLVVGIAFATSLTCWSQAQGMAVEPKHLKIAFVGHSPDGEHWWDPVKNGLAHAKEDFAIDFDFLNPPDGSIEAMARILGGLTPGRYDAVVSTIADYDKLEPALAAIVRRGTPLITVNTGTHAQSERIGALMHVGQPEELAGRLAGEKAAKAGVSSMVCINRYPDNVATRDRCDGFARGLGLPVPGPQLVVDGTDRDMEAEVARFVEMNPQVGAILTMGLTEAHPAIAALHRLKAGAHKPYFVTFDLSRQITAGIRNGVVDFAIDQQPYLQGYLPAALLARRLRFPAESMTMSKIMVFADSKLHRRVATYGVSVKPGQGRHIDSGPGFVTRINVDKVELYGGQFR